jgi:hypothetical protein
MHYFFPYTDRFALICFETQCNRRASVKGEFSKLVDLIVNVIILQYHTKGGLYKNHANRTSDDYLLYQQSFRFCAYDNKLYFLFFVHCLMLSGYGSYRVKRFNCQM